MPAIDRLQQRFEVGDIVNIVGVVTSIAGTPAQPTVAVTTKYAGFAGTTTVIATSVDAIQVVRDTMTPKS
jgi:hypothetical protein